MFLLGFPEGRVQGRAEHKKKRKKKGREGGGGTEREREREMEICAGIVEEKAMAPHSSTLAWKIPWTGEPGGLQSMGSLRVGQD